MRLPSNQSIILKNRLFVNKGTKKHLNSFKMDSYRTRFLFPRRRNDKAEKGKGGEITSSGGKTIMMRQKGRANERQHGGEKGGGKLRRMDDKA